jgi:hypothetical protein
MPDPIRTSLILPPALLDEEHGGLASGIPASLPGPSAMGGSTGRESYERESSQREQPVGGREAASGEPPEPNPELGSALSFCKLEERDVELIVKVEEDPQHPTPLPGMPLRWDPYGRDRTRLEMRAWTAESLAKYLRKVVTHIEANLKKNCVPAAEKLDSFVAQLVANTHRQIKNAPKKDKSVLQGLFAQRLNKFWDFPRNMKVRVTTPEELRQALLLVLEGLAALGATTGMDTGGAVGPLVAPLQLPLSPPLNPPLNPTATTAEAI